MRPIIIVRILLWRRKKAKSEWHDTKEPGKNYVYVQTWPFSFFSPSYHFLPFSRSYNIPKVTCNTLTTLIIIIVYIFLTEWSLFVAPLYFQSSTSFGLFACFEKKHVLPSALTSRLIISLFPRSLLKFSFQQVHYILPLTPTHNDPQIFSYIFTHSHF